MTMHYDLLAHRILERAATQFPNKRIITREGEGTHRYTYADMFGRTARLGNALRELGVGIGDRVGTFAWNTYRHLEAYFAPPTIGAVVHTINIRLAPDDMAYIINHAGDKVLLIDPDQVPLIEAIADRLTTVQHYVILGGPDEVSTTLPNAIAYESILAAASAEYSPASVDEYATMGLCYTSATTGLPKGVAYSHRAVYLHSMASSAVDVLALVRARPGHGNRPDVPCQLLGFALQFHDGRRGPDFPRRPSRPQGHLRVGGERRGDVQRRRSHNLDWRAGLPATFRVSNTTCHP